MSRENKTNLAASVKARLLNRARQTGTVFSELLQRYAMERFLYRLSRSEYAGQFVLKGALLFAVWSDYSRRTTLDIDLLGFVENSLNSLEKTVREVCAVPVCEDGIMFDPSSVKAVRIKEDADYEGVRLLISATIERSRQTVQIDVAFGDSMVPDAVTQPFPVLLDFPAPVLRCYHPLTVLAEKFEAMVKLGSLNSRMKDFYDVWCIIKQSSFSAEEVRTACKSTFSNRGTSFAVEGDFFSEEFAVAPEKQMQWQAFCRKQNLAGTAPDLFQTVVKELRAFFIPLIEHPTPFPGAVQGFPASGTSRAGVNAGLEKL